MEKFYLSEIKSFNNGTADAYAISEYATEKEAVANFHSRMGSAMKDATVSAELLMVISENGGIIKNEKWHRA